MDTLGRLNEVNPQIKIYPLSDKKFRIYGKVHKVKGSAQVLEFLKEYAVAKDRMVYYEPSLSGLEVQSEFCTAVRNMIYGEMNIQAGWCFGWCNRLNGLEYHKSSEVIVAATDLVLLLGHMEDIEFECRPQYNSKMVEAFFVEAGTVVELYANVLHFAPLQAWAEEQFKAAIILPERTNYPLSCYHQANGEDVMLAAVNKWLIMHPETGTGFIGITGDNIEINTI